MQHPRSYRHAPWSSVAALCGRGAAEGAGGHMGSIGGARSSWSLKASPQPPPKMAGESTWLLSLVHRCSFQGQHTDLQLRK